MSREGGLGRTYMSKKRDKKEEMLMETIFTENWEQRLEMQSLKNGRCRKRAYICSPLSAEKDVDFLRNMHSEIGRAHV